MEITENQEYVKAYKKAVKLLEIRLHTKFELRKKLKLRGINLDIIDQVIEKLIEQGYINDKQFAEVYLDNLIRFKTHGYFMLLKKLLERGIEKSLVEALLAEYFPLEQEQKIAQRLVAKKNQLDKAKLAKRLASRGFRSEVIRAVISS